MYVPVVSYQGGQRLSGHLSQEAAVVLEQKAIVCFLLNGTIIVVYVSSLFFLAERDDVLPGSVSGRCMLGNGGIAVVFIAVSSSQRDESAFSSLRSLLLPPLPLSPVAGAVHAATYYSSIQRPFLVSCCT